MEVFELLKKYNIPVADYRVVRTCKEAEEFSSKVGYPVVLKVWDKRISHKTDVGGVILDIWSDKMLETSVNYIKKKFGNVKMLIQKQIQGGIELFAGAKRDESFGTLVLLGLGGVYVEVFRDITTRLCPVDEAMVRDMIYDLESRKIILGYRGQRVDVDSLIDIIINLCRLIEKERIKEIDINPIKANKSSCIVVDARVVK